MSLFCGYKTFPCVEFGWDFHQWSIGFNFYKTLGLNVFIGPFRFEVFDRSDKAQRNYIDKKMTYA